MCSKAQAKRIKAERGLLLLLLEFFSVADDVFTEPDAFSKPKTSLGRVYRNWKLVRAAMDPDFKSERYRRRLYEDRALAPMGRKPKGQR